MKDKFIYSQNSINTYKSCPQKFKYKYVDKVNWMKDDVENREYYEGLDTGVDFHLLCERYFRGLSIETDLSENPNGEIFLKWLDKVKLVISIEGEKTYYPEYGVELRIDGKKIQAKYDLLIVGKDSIEIWDWKTENRKLNYKNIENRMQTIVYLYLVGEAVLKIFENGVGFDKISMNYFQPGFDEGIISINYSEEKHRKNGEILKDYMKSIENSDFKLGFIPRNKKHCKFCEFDKVCNRAIEDTGVEGAKDFGI
ncbi:MAG: PD-(D/E)XK nuclease family protein [Clostridioides sp.]|nr:PD-(D/E)XK nuclease family protein [Clostridioides sp.]